MAKHYDETSDLSDLLVGHRIVAVDMDAPFVEGITDKWNCDFLRHSSTVGLLTLDDGTRIYARGNEGGCICGAGDYCLTKLATTDNIITAAKVIANPGSDYVGNYEGTYVISVFAGNDEINVAEFEGSDGNGYYGTGFQLSVIPASEATS